MSYNPFYDPYYQNNYSSYVNSWVPPPTRAEVRQQKLQEDRKDFKYHSDRRPYQDRNGFSAQQHQDPRRISSRASSRDSDQDSWVQCDNSKMPCYDNRDNGKYYESNRQGVRRRSDQSSSPEIIYQNDRSLKEESWRDPLSYHKINGSSKNCLDLDYQDHDERRTSHSNGQSSSNKLRESNEPESFHLKDVEVAHRSKRQRSPEEKMSGKRRNNHGTHYEDRQEHKEKISKLSPQSNYLENIKQDRVEFVKHETKTSHYNSNQVDSSLPTSGQLVEKLGGNHQNIHQPQLFEETKCGFIPGKSIKREIVDPDNDLILPTEFHDDDEMRVIFDTKRDAILESSLEGPKYTAFLEAFMSGDHDTAERLRIEIQAEEKKKKQLEQEPNNREAEHSIMEEKKKREDEKPAGLDIADDGADDDKDESFDFSAYQEEDVLTQEELDAGFEKMMSDISRLRKKPMREETQSETTSSEVVEILKDEAGAETKEAPREMRSTRRSAMNRNALSMAKNQKSTTRNNSKRRAKNVTRTPGRK